MKMEAATTGSSVPMASSCALDHLSRAIAPSETRSWHDSHSPSSTARTSGPGRVHSTGPDVRLQVGDQCTHLIESSGQRRCRGSARKWREPRRSRTVGRQPVGGRVEPLGDFDDGLGVARTRGDLVVAQGQEALVLDRRQVLGDLGTSPGISPFGLPSECRSC